MISIAYLRKYAAYLGCWYKIQFLKKKIISSADSKYYLFRWKKLIYFWGSVYVFLRVTLLKVIVLSRFLGKWWNINLIQTVGFYLTSSTVCSGDNLKKKHEKKSSENDQSLTFRLNFIFPWQNTKFPNNYLTLKISLRGRNSNIYKQLIICYLFNIFFKKISHDFD